MALSRRERREQRRKLQKEQRLEGLKKAEEAHQVLHKYEYKGLLKIYDKHYLKLLLIPVIIFLAAVVLMGYQLATTGEFINKGVSLSGGIVLTIPVENPVGLDEVTDLLHSKFPNDEIDVRSTDEFGVQKSIIILTDNINAKDGILQALESIIPGAVANSSSETTGAALGESFFRETMTAMIMAFVLMGIVVFVAFRTFAPSVMVIVAVIADILETVVTFNLLGMKMSGAGIAALLMLIGYSVDTDILLTTRVLKSKAGTVFSRTVSAANTGIMLTTTTLIAVSVSFILTDSVVIKEIMIIMLIGLGFDLINTWLQNTALLRYYVEHMLPRKLAAKEAKDQAYEKRMEEAADEVSAELEKEE